MDPNFFAAVAGVFVGIHSMIAFFSASEGFKEISTSQKKGERGVIYLFRLFVEFNIAGLYGWGKLVEFSVDVFRWLLARKNGGAV